MAFVFQLWKPQESQLYFVPPIQDGWIPTLLSLLLALQKQSPYLLYLQALTTKQIEITSVAWNQTEGQRQLKNKSGILEKVICRNSCVHSMKYEGNALKQKLI